MIGPLPDPAVSEMVIVCHPSNLVAVVESPIMRLYVKVDNQPAAFEFRTMARKRSSWGCVSFGCEH